MTREKDTLQIAQDIFREHGGVLRTKDAIRYGIHPRTLYAMRDAGIVEPLTRGLYRLVDMPALANPDLVSVALKVPEGVICLTSALAFHEITTQIPHQVCVAVDRQARPPRLARPPLRVFRFARATFAAGVEAYEIDGVPVRIYGPEKTVADCFKYRNKVGLDVAIEALKLCWQRGKCSVDKLMDFARVCRVEKVMRPYVEAIV